MKFRHRSRNFGFLRILERLFKVIFRALPSWPSKGRIGEDKTALDMWLSLDDKNYKIFRDVIIPSANGTTQIDHIVVSAFGVFIVETKNKSGWIFGDENQAEWTQIVFHKKYKFQNPLRQTYRQKKVLAKFIELDDNYIYPVISFVGNSKFKTKVPANVLNSGLASYIKNFQVKDLSQFKVEEIINKLEKHKAESKLTNHDHVRSLEERYSSKTNCPKCGGSLKSKKAYKGSNAGSEFLGCSNYPQCRYAKSI